MATAAHTEVVLGLDLVKRWREAQKARTTLTSYDGENSKEGEEDLGGLALIGAQHF